MMKREKQLTLPHSLSQQTLQYNQIDEETALLRSSQECSCSSGKSSDETYDPYMVKDEFVQNSGQSARPRNWLRSRNKCCNRLTNGKCCCLVFVICFVLVFVIGIPLLYKVIIPAAVRHHVSSSPVVLFNEIRLDKVHARNESISGWLDAYLEKPGVRAHFYPSSMNLAINPPGTPNDVTGLKIGTSLNGAFDHNGDRIVIDFPMDFYNIKKARLRQLIAGAVDYIVDQVSSDSNAQASEVGSLSRNDDDELKFAHPDQWRMHLDGHVNAKLFGVYFTNIWIYYNIPIVKGVKQYFDQLDIQKVSCTAFSLDNDGTVVPCESLMDIGDDSLLHVGRSLYGSIRDIQGDDDDGDDDDQYISVIKANATISMYNPTVLALNLGKINTSLTYFTDSGQTIKLIKVYTEEIKLTAHQRTQIVSHVEIPLSLDSLEFVSKWKKGDKLNLTMYGIDMNVTHYDNQRVKWFENLFNDVVIPVKLPPFPEKKDELVV
ncbi:hypothetical protein MIR68_006878 [Amoeboaphelidium protococcarum]|nr:hypothetical protein MIR68_006878 [Amoeboaphelidium protococcarum]